MTVLELEEVSHRYGDTRAVENISLRVSDGEVVGLLGPSGCGKTTLLQAIAGHLTPTAGNVRLRGKNVTTWPPEARQIGIVFQESTLFPHLTVGQNVAYGLGPAGIDADRTTALVDHYLELVGLADRRAASPAALSGGEARRVELARALAPTPDILLLDEPLSGLDRALADRLRGEIARIQRETGVTTLFVTHDQEAAMALADRLFVMSEGEVAARGEPRTLYTEPPTPFVAEFLGRSNTLPATVAGQDDGVRVLRIGGAELEFPETGLERENTPEQPTASKTQPVTCHVRPDSLAIGRATASEPALSATVSAVADLGRRYDITAELEAGTELLIEHRGPLPSVGETVLVSIPMEAVTVFGPEGTPLTQSRGPAREGVPPARSRQ